MTNWTQDQEAAALARCDAATKGPWIHTVRDVAKSSTGTYSRIHSKAVNILGGFGRLIAYGARNGTHTTARQELQNLCDGEFIAHARTDLPAAIENGKRLRQALIDNWTHSPLKCPCATRQLEGDTDTPAPFTECTCGLTEALHGEAAEAR